MWLVIIFTVSIFFQCVHAYAHMCLCMLGFYLIPSTNHGSFVYIDCYSLIHLCKKLINNWAQYGSVAYLRLNFKPLRGTVIGIIFFE